MDRPTSTARISPLEIAFVVPPTSDLNTPYASAPRLTGWLRSLGHSVLPVDLSLELFLKIFSREGLTRVFAAIRPEDVRGGYEDVYLDLDRYVDIIDDIVAFAQGRDISCAPRIIQDRFIPMGPAFRTQLALAIRASSGKFDNVDRARHVIALCLEDLCGLLEMTVAPLYYLTAYAMELGTSCSSFDEYANQLTGKPSIIAELIDELADELLPADLDLVCMTVPFPGNLLGALVLGKWLAEHRPGCARVLGGGYCSTELRSLGDPRVFDYADYLVLDDGELPLRRICARLQGEELALHNTFTRVDDKVVFHPASDEKLRFDDLPVPDYDGFPMQRYVHIIYRQSHISRLLSEGTWLKITAAHGCYWHKCAFCDVHLPYVGEYDPMSPLRLADQMDALHQQTGISGFHFTDEAAPPALLFNLSLELLRRRRSYTWWGNIRYDKAFTPDRCRLLAAAGMIAVSGGVEAASDEVLAKIGKGVTVFQVIKVLQAFAAAGITTHGYLINGFPGETNQQVVDGLEILRQMIVQKILRCGLYHHLSVTAHSPIAMDPEAYQVELAPEEFQGFARNALPFVYKDGVERNNTTFQSCVRAMTAFEREAGLGWPVESWFPKGFPATTVSPNFVVDTMKLPHPGARSHRRMCWLGGKPSWYRGLLTVRGDQGYIYAREAPRSIADQLWRCHPQGWSDSTPPKIGDFSADWHEEFRAHGLVLA